MDRLIGAIFLFIIGLALAIWSSRRQFYRRNNAGVEEFKSFGAAVGSRFIEGLATIIGSLLIIAALLHLLGIF
ncbi:MAG: hypothetical protein AB2722_12625 [Candidatus Thiodiazotropha sp.]